ncbi:AMIN domain-containing protein [Sulfuricurvum sp.]|uniref:AMIN domain-containing protein n=1 Tax=Sulfuricurvum sp. TaxID=2025608 RepID=UPI002618AA44|nr:AMIN domain-containing protein [Sulfuricurvum sp.]MDD2780403.1 AMIN domain-containing protein [Sulfuricurvum sp.]
MKHSFFLSLLLLAPLLARENPFFSTNETKRVTSNTIELKPQMENIHYKLPDQARILKEVTFTIQNVDGSIENLKIPIDQSIDWHRPIVLSQSSTLRSPTSANNSSSVNFGFIRFDVKGKILTIKTSDPLIRHFVLSDPNRIVLDFKRDSDLKTEDKQLNAGPYKMIRMGNHGKFVRATITLDGRYSYALNKMNGLISITCK